MVLIVNLYLFHDRLEMEILCIGEGLWYYSVENVGVEGVGY